ncbi:hypothetical protein A2755_00590 [Candidatus Wolfebacteria bacterium RIFCSPHIGHO2_01_FULL_48_22]|uniref:Uncharacterized protein n=2 Tax=Candidatus Wolfeibacteriota TaxID=1752735 RepID=A0A1F8DTA2_9BACT|nr:MAG: hypothetical protein A2755_00590 [Candidatus Wolfebacteria bacterium RIFCSPHIGHO2_01_FULL_48_22]OGM92661.1 MAG: hypothetical protein A2935_04055 [Candidatus Wolfebacteria bacterium RIFCSPLOWO2_01_FULL_47_17b]
MRGAMLKKEFFVLCTDNSLYRMIDRVDSSSRPIVELAAHGSDTAHLPIGTRLSGGMYVCVTADGILLEEKTSPLAALFTESSKAVHAWVQGFEHKPDPIDMRWQYDTAITLESIQGKDLYVIFEKLREMFFEEKSYVY